MSIGQLERLNRENHGNDFIKSYPILRTGNLTPTEIRLIELVLSFESNKKVFQKRYENIARDIGLSGKNPRRSVANIVSKLKELELISTDHKSNYKGEGSNGGGSKTFLSVNLDVLCEYIQSFIDVKTVEDVKITSTEKPLSEVTDVEVLAPDNIGISKPRLKTLQVSNEDIEAPLRPLFVVTDDEVLGDNYTPPNEVTQQSTPLADIIFENFEIKETLRRYVEDESTINYLDVAFVKYITTNDIQVYSLIDLVFCINEIHDSSDVCVEILCALGSDLEKIGELKHEETA
ncbi:hypothetical protein [Gillisia sp. JM1]|uniref:hypothetical protein n=1 Tax=Gillisia sp. JM1 TaxID=1283286 RepID=UPI00042A0BE1|nr:hypothetical protein [Gillisia sp. JM1]